MGCHKLNNIKLLPLSLWDLGDGLDGCALALKENMRNLNKT